jgi:Glycosyl hydrolases family 16
MRRQAIMGTYVLYPNTCSCQTACETRPVAFELEFEDTFDGDTLDKSKWLPYYLPQWSSRARAAARYELRDGRLRLRIDADQEPWCPALDGEIRVSSLQTGVFSGPIGSRIGQHPFHPDAVVTEEQAELRLYTPRYGRVEVRLQAVAAPEAMVALWLIGFEDEPERSGELCVCEIFGSEVSAGEALVGVGTRRFRDPRLDGDFEKVRVAVDATEPHLYAVEWEPGRSVFLVDARRVKTVAEAPAYPMQLMLGIYELEPGGAYPKELVVDHVRGWRLA